MKDLLLMTIPAVIGFICAWFWRRHDYELGRIAGENEQMSRCNARVIQAKLVAFQGGVHFGCEHYSALMSRKGGNVSGKPKTLNTTLVAPCASKASLGT